MRVLAALFLLALIGLVLAFTDDATSSAYYEGRSGEIIFKPENYQEPESFISVQNKKLSFASIDDVNVADLISHVSGSFLPLNPSVDRTEFPSINIFEPPMATVVASIVSLSADEARSIPSLAGQSFTPIRGSAYPSDSLSRLTTMLSGTPPSIHGIVGSSWPTSMGLVTAFVSELGQPRAANLPTLLSNAFSGKSLVLSASGSGQFASSMNALPALLAKHAYWNNVQLFWTGDNIVSSSHVAKEHISREEVFLGALKNSPLPVGAKVEHTASHGTLVVSLPKGVAAKFDLYKPADLLLVAELRIASTLISLLTENEAVKDLVSDSIPDYLGLSFVSLDAIKTAYGVDSPQSKAALVLIAAALERINTAVQQVYSTSNSVLLGVASSPRMSLSAELMNVLVSSDAVVLEPHPETFLPAVYLHPTASAADETRLCTQLTDVAKDSGVQVMCLFSLQHQIHMRDDDTYPIDQQDPIISDPDGGISSQDLQEFHTVLWSSIFIGFALAGVVWVMCSIDTSKDTMLFRVAKSQH